MADISDDPEYVYPDEDLQPDPEYTYPEEDPGPLTASAWWQVHGGHFLRRAEAITRGVEDEDVDLHTLKETLDRVAHIVEEVTSRQQGL